MILDNVGRRLRYELLPATSAGAEAEDGDGDGDNTGRSIIATGNPWRSDRAKILSMVVVIASVVVLVSLGLRFIIAESATRSNNNAATLSSSSQDCGSTRDSALTRGCVFDIVTFAWVAPACHDRELSAEFGSLRAWGWFLDQNSTQAVPQSEVEDGRFDVVYVSRAQLAYRCVYMWRKLHRAILRRGPLDSFVAQYNTTEYCGRMLLDGHSQKSESVDKSAVLMMSRFASCGI
ncbi:uncharacterized protein Z520_07801 [Fonsecaea multimorphosa CBS 102226]|uniref:Uncharacterized protein n=1 Tax=Fonsecaea multimorphosa CBS 102226 TaxID=1442371 RepID=A0A0D2H3W8_9EURO|nr:uncharacterized protein Z520_07801 [Fonsecaea multimorphosa CBS 102226]KIX96535.1 hypothetical protein Z520_07801 [Fonsecaea multimorphosa CBS 102226]OAL28024.1 hypothetical protein AYO22_03051 [Fonsecaea multimorphosa]